MEVPQSLLVDAFAATLEADFVRDLLLVVVDVDSFG